MTAEEFILAVRRRAGELEPGLYWLPFPELLDRLFRMVDNAYDAAWDGWQAERDELRSRIEELEEELKGVQVQLEGPSEDYADLTAMIVGEALP